MPSFFIDRPIFAWVVAIFIMIAGAISLPLLPVSQYPNVAPPTLTVYTHYNGAPPEDIYQSVTQLIEQQLNSVPNLLYYESTSDSSGLARIVVTFEPGTNLNQASVDTQNAINRVQARLPKAVAQQGVQISQSGSGFLMFIGLKSTDGKTDAVGLGDYLNRNVIGEISRIPGVGQVQLFSPQRAMRIWMNPDKMLGLNLSVDDVINAISAQNAQVSAGRIGSKPNPVNQQISATVLVKGQLSTPEDFGSIVLRANPDGSTVRLRDVARIEIGAETYNFSTRIDGQPAAGIGVQLSPTGNALATSNAVRAKMAELAKFFPPGFEYMIPYDTSPFVRVSIEKVLHTLLEAMGLVFVVMFIFLQSIRYTVIPALVVPVALLGACAILLATGSSINVLTMFAMVLAIGILVDDAIVVVENVERIMAHEGLQPKEATRKAMSQITGAIIGIWLVLTAVFVPMAFFPGAVGVIYRQFSVTMVGSILFSGFMALSLTPALCASFLKPVPESHHEKRGFFGWFNRGFARTSHGYTSMVDWMIRRAGRFMVIYLALIIGLGYLFIRLPSSFLPNEDQGFVLVDMQTPPESAGNRTQRAVEKVEAFFGKEPAVDHRTVIEGYSFSGAGDNAALAFITFKDWSVRGFKDSAQAIADRANAAFMKLKDVVAFALSPPPISGLGTSNGFTFRLQDRSGLGDQALSAAASQLLAAAAKSPILTGLRTEGLPDAAQINLVIDREKANAFGVAFGDINSAISAYIGSAYINDFPNAGRLQRVMVQAGEHERMQAADLLNLNVRNASGGMVPFSAFAHIEWAKGPLQVVAYNGYPAVRISGNAAPGYSSGEAIKEMERLADDLPPGFGYEWTGQSLQEIQSGSQAPFLMGMTVLFVFLLLAALYESWSIPLSVMLVVPLGIIGAVLAVMMRGMSNDVYFKVGLIAIIGLSAKNAILIIEFAKDLRARGMSVFDATIEASRIRFRPIIMTSLAFSLGVTPLAVAVGASAASQNAIGTGVLGGMITATVIAVPFVPVFFVFVVRLFGGRKALEAKPEEEPSLPLEAPAE
ncbi:MAG: multidrug efflux RND transporter permease subunit [Rhizobiales bacterium 65-79]|jgi:multidrug efflux pump|nr:multidrug efflux RND transporter permease subunit [Hyphomicrobiales bacterium]OJU05629.1 MAG: multidrug efflux RND transporter permease subunit [Rhizobiales bacterium 65-79]